MSPAESPGYPIPLPLRNRVHQLRVVIDPPSVESARESSMIDVNRPCPRAIALSRRLGRSVENSNGAVESIPPLTRLPREGSHVPAMCPQELRSGIDEIETISRCQACESALRSAGRESVGFVLLEALTVPVVGCSEHLEQFRAACGHTTQHRAELLHHRPAGGISCPGCRLSPHNPEQPVVQVSQGAVGVLACPRHRSEIIERYHSGLRTRRQLTESL